jgi:hypothetical protein
MNLKAFVYKFIYNNEFYFVETYDYHVGKNALEEYLNIPKNSLPNSVKPTIDELKIIWSHNNKEEEAMNLAVNAWNIIHKTDFYYDTKSNKVKSKSKKPTPTNDEVYNFFKKYKLTINKSQLTNKDDIELQEKRRKLIYEIKLFMNYKLNPNDKPLVYNKSHVTYTSGFNDEVAKNYAFNNKLYNNTGFLVPIDTEQAIQDKLWIHPNLKSRYEELVKRCKEVRMNEVMYNEKEGISWEDLFWM